MARARADHPYSTRPKALEVTPPLKSSAIFEETVRFLVELWVGWT